MVTFYLGLKALIARIAIIAKILIIDVMLYLL